MFFIQSELRALSKLPPYGGGLGRGFHSLLNIAATHHTMNISGHRNTVSTNVGIHFFGLYSSVKETKKKIKPPIKRYATTAIIIIIQVISIQFSFSTP